MKIKYLETTNDDYTEKSSSDIQVWRNVRLIDSDVDRAVFADGSYCKGSIIGEDVLLNRRCFVLNSAIGNKSQIGFNTKVLHAEIGKYCSISWDCSIGGPNHNMRTISTYNMRKQNHYNDKTCVIGNDVWMGSGAIMFRGITVGNGAVVGGGSVLTHSVQPYEIVAGVPARHLGWRFEESIRNRLEKIEWWDFPSEVISRNIDLFDMELTEEIVDELERIKQKIEIDKK